MSQNLAPQFRVVFPTEFLGGKNEAFITGGLSVLEVELLEFSSNDQKTSVTVQGGTVWGIAGGVANILGISIEDPDKIRRFSVSRIKVDHREMTKS